MEQRQLGMSENLSCSIFHSQLIGRRRLSQWNMSSVVRRLKLVRQLSSHNGCVNTIQFDTTGNLLLSGSDDKMLKIFDPNEKEIVILRQFGLFRRSIFQIYSLRLS